MILVKKPGFDASLLLLRTFKNAAKIYFCEVQDLNFKIQSKNFSSKLSPRRSKTKPLLATWPTDYEVIYNDKVVVAQSFRLLY